MNQFYDITAQFHELSYFIGKVKYATDAKINDYFANPEKLNSTVHMTNLRYPQTMLVKRKAFSYEEEVRLIYSDNPASSQGAPAPTPLHRVPIDPNSLFDYIELDPWMDATTSAAATTSIQAAGYTGTVKQSGLYKFPNFVVRLA